MKPDRNIFFHFITFFFTILIISSLTLSYIFKDSLFSKFKHFPANFTNVSIKEKTNQFLFVKHPTLGFITNKGKYTLTLSNPFVRKDYSFQVTINQDGYRYPLDTDEKYKNNIWLFGCSFNWGWGISDKDTISALLQNTMPEYKIHNYSIPGYGSLHALIQLKELLKEKKQSPNLAIFMYSTFHNIRNVVAPSRLKEIQSLKEFFSPSAFIKNDKLSVEMVPINLSLNKKEEPSVEEKIQITNMIFTEIYQLCLEKKITPILCVQEGSLSNPVVLHCQNLGFEICDLIFDISKPKMNNRPYDQHPSAYTQKLYAERIIKYLSKHKLINTAKTIIAHH